MISLRRFREILLCLLGICSGCFALPAQPFVNLDFEGIRPGGIDPGGIWLTWNLAAPGWTRPRGGDSVFVYHNTPPQDSIAQWYFLVDSSCEDWSPLEGDFSFALVSGHYNRNDPSSPWQNAYIEQQGVIPEDAQSLRLLTDGEITLTLNSTEIPLLQREGYLFAGDISSFAGELVTMRITSESMNIQDPVIVDGINFSVQSVPEASSSHLLICGLVILFVCKKWRALR